MRSDHEIGIVRPQSCYSQTADMGKSDRKVASSATEEGVFTVLGSSGVSEPNETGGTANLAVKTP